MSDKHEERAKKFMAHLDEDCPHRPSDFGNGDCLRCCEGELLSALSEQFREVERETNSKHELPEEFLMRIQENRIALEDKILAIVKAGDALADSVTIAYHREFPALKIKGYVPANVLDWQDRTKDIPR